MNGIPAKWGGWRRLSVAVIALLLPFFVASAAVPASDKAPKSYPERGKVVAASISEHTDYVPISPPDSKGRTSGGQAFVHRNWVYRVETDDGFYEFKGGKKQSMATGDAVEFRRVKDTVYVLADDKETKYQILSTTPKPTK